MTDQMRTLAPDAGTSPSGAVRPLLDVVDLAVHFQTQGGLARVVDGANLTVRQGEIYGIAGESGCGKTTLVEAILQIIRFPNRVASGEVRFTPRGGETVDLMRLSPDDLRRVRGSQIAYIPQGSMNSLNPIMRIGTQIEDAMTAHGIRKAAARARVPDLLGRVGLDRKVARLYPHELSGGMKQRCIIAIAIGLEPDLIVADEPTTALDVNVQRQILEMLIALRAELGVAIVIVSHDLPVHAQLTDRIGIMYAGQIVETADVRSVVRRPRHPYTQGLIHAIPTIGVDQRLEGIAGRTSSPLAWPSGCRFNPRCPRAMAICKEVMPRLAELPQEVAEARDADGASGPGHRVACHLYPESTP